MFLLYYCDTQSEFFYEVFFSWLGFADSLDRFLNIQSDFLFASEDLVTLT